MTCLLGIVTPWGAWMASDHRLTSLPGGRLITDTSVKHLGMRTKNGSAIVIYTGFGMVTGEDVSDWLRTTLRGESRTLEETADLIAARASARFGTLALRGGVLHIFIMAAFSGGQAFLATIANTDRPFNSGSAALRPDFVVAPAPIVRPYRILGGAGGHAVDAADCALLKVASEKRPRDPRDFLRLLAAVNRRTAMSARPGSETMSAGCVASYLSPEEGGALATEVFGDEGDVKMIAWPPFLLYGIDATEMMRAMPQPGPGGGGEQEWNIEEAARRAIEPRKRR